ncbi:cell wall hydrolase, partial [Herbiconiux daphne]
EAGGQGHDAMQFVADTVVNRVHSPKFPNTVEGVIYQKGQFEWTKHNRHRTTQDLTRTRDRMMKRKDPHGNHNWIWLDAMEVASTSLSNGYKPKTNALYFSTKTIKAHSYSYRHHSKHKR